MNRFIILSIGQSQEENSNGPNPRTQTRFEVSEPEIALGKGPRNLRSWLLSTGATSGWQFAHEWGFSQGQLSRYGQGESEMELGLSLTRPKRLEFYTA